MDTVISGSDICIGDLIGFVFSKQEAENQISYFSIKNALIAREGHTMNARSDTAT